MPASREPRRRHRIAAMLAPTFPTVALAPVAEALAELAAALDAEFAVFHTAMPHPRELPPRLRAAIGTAHFVPPNVLIHCEDAEHWRRAAPNRFRDLVATLVGATGMSEASVVLRAEFQSACCHARWLQAWAPDLLIARGLDATTLTALLAAELLGTPLLWLPDPGPPAGEFAPLHDLFLARAKARLDALPPPPAALPRLAALLAAPRPADAPALGPAAAFVGPRRPRSGPPPGVLPFVVLGAERTGSNLLVELLADQTVAACANELFNPDFHRTATVPWLPVEVPDPDALHRLRAASPGRLHERLLADGRALGATAVGFKLLYHHALVDQRIVDHLAALDDVAIVHLLREDRLRRWLSFQRAAATNQWSTARTAQAPAQAPPVPIDAPTLLADFALQEICEDRFRATFAGRPQLELDYAGFSTDLPGTTRRLSTLLRVPLRERPPGTRKTGGEPLARLVADVGELQDALRGTRWARLLDDPERAETTR